MKKFSLVLHVKTFVTCAEPQTKLNGTYPPHITIQMIGGGT